MAAESVHVMGYRSTSDEAWGRRPICRGCRHEWPCHAATAEQEVARLRGLLTEVAGCPVHGGWAPLGVVVPTHFYVKTPEDLLDRIREAVES